MNLWIIAAITIAVLAIAGVALATLGVADEQENIECSICGRGCSYKSNCGLASCGAVNGGKCGCGG